MPLVTDLLECPGTARTQATGRDGTDAGSGRDGVDTGQLPGLTSGTPYHSRCPTLMTCNSE